MPAFSITFSAAIKAAQCTTNYTTLWRTFYEANGPAIQPTYFSSIQETFLPAIEMPIPPTHDAAVFASNSSTNLPTDYATADAPVGAAQPSTYCASIHEANRATHYQAFDAAEW